MEKKKNEFNFAKAIKKYVTVIKNLVVSPNKALSEDIDNLSDIKESALFAVLISFIAMIINLIATMITALPTKSFDWATGKVKTVLEFDNLGNINYVDAIFKTFFGYLVVIAFIAGIFYIGSLIVKKEVKFSKMLGVSTLAFIPSFLLIVVVGPLVGMISLHVRSFVTILAVITYYTVVYMGMNNEMKLDDKTKFYFNVLVFTLIIFAFYFVAVKYVESAISTLGSSLLK